MEGTMAVITPVAYDFTPRYWAQCSGQLLAINTNQALFSLLGTTYGGNGIQTFALPDLRGRVASGVGQGQGLSNYTLGEVYGAESQILNMNNLPPHNHNGNIQMKPLGSSSVDSDSPSGAYPATIVNGYTTNLTGATPMGSSSFTNTAIGQTGSSAPVPLLTPYLTLNFVICTQGIYPSRN
jgi:microcystin-dependent protein